MLILVVAENGEEFRNIVLQDIKSLGDGSASFLKGEEKIVNWRSSVDPSYKARYVWAKDYQEARLSLDQDNFRILSKSTEKVEKQALLSSEALAAIVGIVILTLAVVMNTYVR